LYIKVEKLIFGFNRKFGYVVSDLENFMSFGKKNRLKISDRIVDFYMKLYHISIVILREGKWKENKIWTS
jgi:hypothetical protein